LRLTTALEYDDDEDAIFIKRAENLK
jgi:hypothetical protein